MSEHIGEAPTRQTEAFTPTSGQGHEVPSHLGEAAPVHEQQPVAAASPREGTPLEPQQGAPESRPAPSEPAFAGGGAPAPVASHGSPDFAPSGDRSTGSAPMRDTHLAGPGNTTHLDSMHLASGAASPTRPAPDRAPGTPGDAQATPPGTDAPANPGTVPPQMGAMPHMPGGSTPHSAPTPHSGSTPRPTAAPTDRPTGQRPDSGKPFTTGPLKSRPEGAPRTRPEPGPRIPAGRTEHAPTVYTPEHPGVERTPEQLVHDLPGMSAKDRQNTLLSLSPEGRRQLAGDHAFVDKLKDTLPPKEFARTAAHLLVDVDPRAEAPVTSRGTAHDQIERMLQDPETAAALLKAGASVHVVPRDVEMTDVGPLKEFKGDHFGGASGEGRGLDDARGSGGLHTAITEENLRGVTTTIGADEHYTDGYSTTTHEFAHTIHLNALSEGDRQTITDSFTGRKELDALAQQKLDDPGKKLSDSDQKKLDDFEQKKLDPAARWPDGPRKGSVDGIEADNYSSRDELEYFAQATNSYLGTNHGTDPYTGHDRQNGPDWVRANAPELLPLLEKLYGKDPAALHPEQSNPVDRVKEEDGLYSAFRDLMGGDTHEPHPSEEPHPDAHAETPHAEQPHAETPHTEQPHAEQPHHADRSDLLAPPPKAAKDREPLTLTDDEILESGLRLGTAALLQQTLPHRLAEAFPELGKVDLILGGGGAAAAVDLKRPVQDLDMRLSYDPAAKVDKQKLLDFLAKETLADHHPDTLEPLPGHVVQPEHGSATTASGKFGGTDASITLAPVPVHEKQMQVVINGEHNGEYVPLNVVPTDRLLHDKLNALANRKEKEGDAPLAEKRVRDAMDVLALHSKLDQAQVESLRGNKDFASLKNVVRDVVKDQKGATPGPGEPRLTNEQLKKLESIANDLTPKQQVKAPKELTPQQSAEIKATQAAKALRQAETAEKLETEAKAAAEAAANNPEAVHKAELAAEAARQARTKYEAAKVAADQAAADAASAQSSSSSQTPPPPPASSAGRHLPPPPPKAAPAPAKTPVEARADGEYVHTIDAKHAFDAIDKFLGTDSGEFAGQLHELEGYKRAPLNDRDTYAMLDEHRAHKVQTLELLQREKPRLHAEAAKAESDLHDARLAKVDLESRIGADPGLAESLRVKTEETAVLQQKSERLSALRDKADAIPPNFRGKETTGPKDPVNALYEKLFADSAGGRLRSDPHSELVEAARGGKKPAPLDKPGVNRNHIVADTMLHKYMTAAVFKARTMDDVGRLGASQAFGEFSKAITPDSHRVLDAPGRAAEARLGSGHGLDFLAKHDLEQLKKGEPDLGTLYGTPDLAAKLENPKSVTDVASARKSLAELRDGLGPIGHDGVVKDHLDRLGTAIDGLKPDADATGLHKGFDDLRQAVHVKALDDLAVTNGVTGRHQVDELTRVLPNLHGNHLSDPQTREVLAKRLDSLSDTYKRVGHDPVVADSLADHAKQLRGGPVPGPETFHKLADTLAPQRDGLHQAELKQATDRNDAALKANPPKKVDLPKLQSDVAKAPAEVAKADTALAKADTTAKTAHAALDTARAKELQAKTDAVAAADAAAKAPLDAAKATAKTDAATAAKAASKEVTDRKQAAEKAEKSLEKAQAKAEDALAEKAANEAALARVNEELAKLPTHPAPTKEATQEAIDRGRMLADKDLVGAQYGGAFARKGPGAKHPATLFEEALKAPAAEVPGRIAEITTMLSNSSSNLRLGDKEANQWIQNFLDPHITHDEELLTAVAHEQLPPEVLYTPHTGEVLHGLSILEDARLVPKELGEMMAPKTHQDLHIQDSTSAGSAKVRGLHDVPDLKDTTSAVYGKIPVSSSGETHQRPAASPLPQDRVDALNPAGPPHVDAPSSMEVDPPAHEPVDVTMADAPDLKRTRSDASMNSAHDGSLSFPDLKRLHVGEESSSESESELPPPPPRASVPRRDVPPPPPPASAPRGFGAVSPSPAAPSHSATPHSATSHGPEPMDIDHPSAPAWEHPKDADGDTMMGGERGDRKRTRDEYEDGDAHRQGHEETAQPPADKRRRTPSYENTSGVMHDRGYEAIGKDHPLTHDLTGYVGGPGKIHPPMSNSLLQKVNPHAAPARPGEAFRPGADLNACLENVEAYRDTHYGRARVSGQTMHGTVEPIPGNTLWKRHDGPALFGDGPGAVQKLMEKVQAGGPGTFATVLGTGKQGHGHAVALVHDRDGTLRWADLTDRKVVTADGAMPKNFGQDWTVWASVADPKENNISGPHDPEFMTRYSTFPQPGHDHGPEPMDVDGFGTRHTNPDGHSTTGTFPPVVDPPKPAKSWAAHLPLSSAREDRDVEKGARREANANRDNAAANLERWMKIHADSGRGRQDAAGVWHLGSDAANPEVSYNPANGRLTSRLDPTTLNDRYTGVVGSARDLIRHGLRRDGDTGMDEHSTLSGGDFLMEYGRRNPETREYWATQDTRVSEIDAFADTLAAEHRPLLDVQQLDGLLPDHQEAHQHAAGLLQQHDGFVLGENHRDAPTWSFLTQQMPALSASGVRTVYLEHFRDDALQSEVTAFMGGGDPSLALTEGITRHERHHGLPSGSVLGTLTAARDNHVDVRLVDGYPARRPQPPVDGPATEAGAVSRENYQRARRMNAYTVEAIRDHQALLGDGAKYVVVLGAAHVGQHDAPPGLPVAPGVSESLGVPGVAFDRRTDGPEGAGGQRDVALPLKFHQIRQRPPVA